MFVSTHVRVAIYFYFRLKYATHKLGISEEEKGFQLHPIAFAYGSIKPDISKMAYHKHHFEDTLSIFIDHLNKAKDESSESLERSIALGVTIHFLCDYFCKYHAKSPYKSHNLLRHVLYELNLHLNIFSNLIAKTIKGNHDLTNIQRYDDKNLLSEMVISEIEATIDSTYGHRVLMDKAVHNLVEMLKVYHTKSPSPALDRDFAFTAVNVLLNEVVGVKALRVEENEDSFERWKVYENSDIYGYFSAPNQWGNQHAEKIG